MRGSLKLPLFGTSRVLDFPEITHRFFYASDGLDFASPLNTALVETLLKDYNLQKLCVLNQNHTSNIVIFPSVKGYTHADGMITQLPHVAILVRHADCQAALFYDPCQKVIAAVHDGFRGQCLEIYSQTIALMQKQYGSKPADIRVALSASLGFCHAEFINYKEEFPKRLHHYAQNSYMDLKQIARDELLACGLKEAHIEIDPRCSFEDKNLFYSYRRDKTKKRMGSLIVLHKN